MTKKTFKIVSFILFVIAMILMCAIALPIIKSYGNSEEFKAYIESFGAWSLPVMFFIQISQIIVALIPGEAVEFLAGTLYGWLGGLIFCLSGIAFGQTIIFLAVKFFGRDFVEKAAGSKALAKLKFLSDERKLKSVIFILFFIPGTPKDLITYAAPLTKIKLSDFLIITLIARIPSVVSSTLAGAAFSQHNLVLLVCVYAGIAVFSAVGVLVYRKWEKMHDKKLSE